MSTYRAVSGEDSPVVVCDDDEPGTVMAMVGRQQDAEEIAAALNSREPARCQHCPNLADERSFMCEDCAYEADTEVQELRDQVEGTLGALVELVLADDEAMRRARKAYVSGPPHGVKHSEMDRLEHMRNAIRAALALPSPSSQAPEETT